METEYIVNISKFGKFVKADVKTQQWVDVDLPEKVALSITKEKAKELIEFLEQSVW